MVNFFMQRGEFRRLYEHGRILLLFALLVGCNPVGNTAKYVYYFNNGTVYLEQTLVSGGHKVYWHDPDGALKQMSGQQIYNGLAVLPAIHKEIPSGEYAFKWIPAREEVARSLNTFLKDYDSAISRFSKLGLDASLRPEETKEQAFQRIVEKLAQLYCSYEEQERGYQIPTDPWHQEK
jgi:hypothetical protein